MSPFALLICSKGPMALEPHAGSSSSASRTILCSGWIEADSAAVAVVARMLITEFGSSIAKKVLGSHLKQRAPRMRITIHQVIKQVRVSRDKEADLFMAMWQQGKSASCFHLQPLPPRRSAGKVVLLVTSLMSTMGMQKVLDTNSNSCWPPSSSKLAKEDGVRVAFEMRRSQGMFGSRNPAKLDSAPETEPRCGSRAYM